MPAKNFKVDFIGIGAGKSGSTWLHANLVRHPQICDANLKELNYFSDLYDEHPYSWYASQFRGCDTETLKGEFSVTYLPHPLAAARIKERCPDAKLIAIVRDPVKRTFSNYLHSQRKGDVSPDVPFRDYIRDEENLLTSRYADLLSSYYAHFSEEQILVVVMEKFLQDLPAGYLQVFSFLGVDDPDFMTPEFYDRRNEARAYRFIKLENVLVRSYRWLSRRGHTRLVKTIAESGAADLVRVLNRSSSPPPQLDSESDRTLTEYFRPANAALGELLGEDLACWDRQTSNEQ